MISIENVLSLEQAIYAIKRKGGYYKVGWSECLDGYINFYDIGSLKEEGKLIGGWSPRIKVLVLFEENDY